MNMDDLMKLVLLDRGKQSIHPSKHPMLGKRCLIRTYSAGDGYGSGDGYGYC